MIHVASRSPAIERGSRRASFFRRACTSSQIPFVWRAFAAGGDDEVVGVGADRPHVQDHDAASQLVLREGRDPAGLFDGRQAALSVPGWVSTARPPG